MRIYAEGICKSYGEDVVLSNLSFDVAPGECVSLIGPSGAGKTTLLKIIAGIESSDEGRLTLDPTPSKVLPVLMVFQDYVLFPHQTIFSNVAFGLRARRLSRDEVRRRVTEYLDYVGLGDKASLYPNQLSAGQQQRTAIARAMVVNPGVLLLDEPFANLDRNLKMETAQFIRSTCRHFGTTIISVTHDLEEAFAMSDRIGILLDGRLEQYDTARTVYFSPATWAAARFLGPVNMLPRTLFPLLEWSDEAPDEELVFSRGEGLELIPDPGGVWEIEEIRFVGVLILYTIFNGHNGGSRLKVYCVGEGLDQGDHVRCRVGRYFTDSREVERRDREWKDGV